MALSGLQLTLPSVDTNKMLRRRGRRRRHVGLWICVRMRLPSLLREWMLRPRVVMARVWKVRVGVNGGLRRSVMVVGIKVLRSPWIWVIGDLLHVRLARPGRHMIVRHGGVWGWWSCRSGQTAAVSLRTARLSEQRRGWRWRWGRVCEASLRWLSGGGGWGCRVRR